MKRVLLSCLLCGCLAVPGFSQGFYFEFKLTGDKVNGNMKTYAQDGNSRSELNIALGAPGSGQAMNRNVVALVLKDNPDKTYMLDVDKKTYSELDISKRPDTKDSPDDYDITVIGKEKVNGYDATHVKVKNKRTNQEQDMWTSTGVANYSELEKIKTKYTGKENLTKALAAKGAEGFPVRFIIKEMNTTVQLDLVAASTKTNPASLFSLDGYTKSTGAGADRQQMMQQLQNMTPEERQKFIEQMRQQQGAPK
jgi:hypothetical protein